MEEPVTNEMLIIKEKIGLFPWWVMLLWGMLALFIGIMFLTTPAVTTVVLITFLGAFWFVGGLFSLFSLAVDKTNMGWKILLAVLNIIVGLIILAQPFFSTIILLTFLVIFVGFWACIMGVAHMYQGFSSKDWGNVVLGIFSLFFGLIILAFPPAMAALLPFIAGIFAVMIGISAIVVSFTVKKAAAAITV